MNTSLFNSRFSFVLVLGVVGTICLNHTANAMIFEDIDSVLIPSGYVEAIWLTPRPVRTKDKSPSEKDQLKPRIRVEEFHMMDHAVTNNEYLDFLKENPSWSKDRASKLFVDESYLTRLTDASPKAPVTNVSWFAARAFCHSKKMRLPAISEWEYVAAASESKVDANRDEIFLKRILDWYGEPAGSNLKSVKSIYKNKYGVWDMHGLIWEWVEDFNSSFVSGESREDGSFNKDMFCGAGAMTSADKENYAAFMRFAFRSALKGRSTVWNLGFRCVY